MRVAGLSAILQNGDDAGRALGCRRRSLAVLPVERLTHIIGISSKTLRGGHHAVDVNGEASGARGAGRAGRDQGDPRGDFGGSVFLARGCRLRRGGGFRRDGDARGNLGFVSWERHRAVSVRSRSGGEEAGPGGLGLLYALSSLEAPDIGSPGQRSLLPPRPREGREAGLQRALLVGRIHLSAVPGHAPGRGFGAAPRQEPPLVAGEKLHFAVGCLIRHELLGVGRGREGFDFSAPAPKRCPSLRRRDNLVSLVEPQYLIGTSARAKSVGVERRLGNVTCREGRSDVYRRWLLPCTLISRLFGQGFAISVVSFRVETILRGRNMENNLCVEGGGTL